MAHAPTYTDMEKRRRRRAGAIALHAIEGITFTDEDLTFAEEMDHMNLSDDERIAAITARHLKKQTDLAE